MKNILKQIISNPFIYPLAVHVVASATIYLSGIANTFPNPHYQQIRQQSSSIQPPNTLREPVTGELEKSVTNP